MRLRILLIALAGVIAVLVGGLVWLGANPPNPTPKSVEKTLPNEKFQTH